tara:strand:+ start:1098 stop:1889 length:792 start_codon:yes stop_codon:yes gene_type:complete
MKDIFFLHGLPRSGNTVFGSIMNQNPDVAATANSICADMMGDLFKLKHTDIFKNYPDHKSFDNVAKKVLTNYYEDWKQDYIIDRGIWGYPINLKFLKETRSNIKIIVLVRDVTEILGSFIDWCNREPTAFLNRYGPTTVEEKCHMLMNKEGVIVKGLIGIKHLIDHQPKEMYHVVTFNDLVKNTKDTIDKVYDFLDIPRFKHDYINIGQFKVNGMSYDDTDVGNGLHKLKTGAINDYKESYNVYDIIPKNVINKYKECNFWIK